jgi:hypothetical protein
LLIVCLVFIKCTWGDGKKYLNLEKMEWAVSSGEDGKSKGRMSEDAETKSIKKTKKGGK